jgi:hypothetical protein
MLNSGTSRPGDGNDNYHGEISEGTQGGEQETGKGKGTKDGKGIGTGKATEEGNGQGNSTGKDIVKQTS